MSRVHFSYKLFSYRQRTEDLEDKDHLPGRVVIMTEHGDVLVELNRILCRQLELRRTDLIGAEQNSSMINPPGTEVCITKWVFCHTLLSYKIGGLSYKCITNLWFCHTFLYYKMGVLSYKIRIRIATRITIIAFSNVSLYNVSSSLNIINLSEKKDKGTFSISVLSYIVIQFYSYYLLILFSSSSSFSNYYYYYYYY